MAMELAMLVMVVTFALSILLTTFALMQANKKNIELRDTKEKIALEQIGEDYLVAFTTKQIDAFKDKYSAKYLIEIGQDNKKLTVRNLEGNELLFTVEIDDNEKITKWELN